MEAAETALQSWTGLRLDVLSALFCLVLLFGYHLFLVVKSRRDGHYTFRAVMASAREAWVRAVMAEQRDVLAVQTLRNSTMAATFLASTAIFLITGVLTLSTQVDKLGTSWQAFNAGNEGPEMLMVKVLVMLVDLFVAFFSFTIAIRLFHHVGYMINVPVGGQYGRVPPALVVRQLDRAGDFYWLGMRSYFTLVPIVLWMFGPHFMVAATGTLIVVMYKLDHMPCGPRGDIPCPRQAGLPPDSGTVAMLRK